MAKKGNRIQVILECTEHKGTGLPGTSRYITNKNKKLKTKQKIKYTNYHNLRFKAKRKIRFEHRTNLLQNGFFKKFKHNFYALLRFTSYGLLKT